LVVKVGLALQWQCGTDLVVYPTYWLSGLRHGDERPTLAREELGT